MLLALLAITRVWHISSSQDPAVLANEALAKLEQSVNPETHILEVKHVQIDQARLLDVLNDVFITYEIKEKEKKDDSNQ